jgi:class 3 adenylate cyclase/S1-C subfamily serine protease
VDPDTPLSPSGQEPTSRHTQERRVVTTLFCDLVGFTSLSERNDPELVDGFLRRYQAVVRTAIESYGGTLEKFIGDAVVAVFGVPTLHEDDPERAVRAGLRLVDEVDALRGIGGQAVEVRVGINTGEALVRLSVDPASGEGLVTGDAVNVTARLQSAAPPMAVAVGELTHVATERIFSFEPCHPVTLKGKAKPLSAWIATAPLARTGSELRDFASPFVGREDELATLQALLDDATEARAPRLALIVGEPGIGKSRLLAEFARRLDDLPQVVTWREGRCLPFGPGITFWALSEIVRESAGIRESDGAARAEARLESILPETRDRDRLRARLRPLVGLAAEEAGREENFAAWREFLESLAASGPAIIVVQDLHWADEALLAFMDFMAQSTARVPLLVLASARPETAERVGPGAGFATVATRLALGPLSGEETSQLLLTRLGTRSLPVRLQAKLLEASGGNPLFAEELVRLLEDRDLLVRRGGTVALKEGPELPVPDSIGALIAARLELLSAERKALLADAAVVGRSFWAGAVAAVGPHEFADVLEGFYDLVAKELVRPERASSIEGETEFVFVHALVRDVAYSQLTMADRAGKHAALARWLEERTAGRSEDMAEVLAFHYGTALELAYAAGLFELVDELEEPTTRYLELAGGRAAPLDAAAAAAHFARAERVAGEAAKPKRRFFLSRRARHTLKRRAPLLATAVAVIAASVIAGLALWTFGLAHAGAPGPVRLTAAQIQQKFGPGVVQITSKVLPAVGGKPRWKEVQGTGFIVSRSGLIVTSSALVNDSFRHGPMVRAVNLPLHPLWVTCEIWGANGRYAKVKGLVIFDEANFGGCALIAVDPHKAPLAPIPLGERDAARARVGDTVVMLHRFPLFTQLESTTMHLTAVWHQELTGSNRAKTTTALLTDSRLDASSLGAPLIATSGKVIGWVGPIPYLRFNDMTGDHASSVANSAVAVPYLPMFIENASQNLGGRKTWLGIEGVTVNDPPGNAKALGLPVSHGFLVEIVDPQGPAGRAGIRGGTRVKMVSLPYLGERQYLTGGDVIVAVDGKAVRSEGEYNQILDEHKPGDIVKVKFYRGHRLLTVKARLAAFPYTPATG